MVTKSYTSKEITILVQNGHTVDDRIILIEHKRNKYLEKYNSLSEKIFSDNILGLALFSAADFMLLKANQNFLNYFDEPYNKAENIIGLRVCEFISDINDVALKKSWIEVIKTCKPCLDKEYLFKNRNGNTYFDIIMIPIIEKGKVKYIYIIVKDVTERVLYRKQLEEKSKIITNENTQFKAIIENMCNILFIANKDGSYLKINKSARELIGSLELKKIGDSFRYNKYFTIEGNEIHPENFLVYRVMRGEKVVHEKLILKNTEKTVYLDVNGTPVFDSEGRVSLGIFCAKDITHQVKYEQAIREQCAYFCQIIDLLQLPILRLSYPNLNIIAINKKAYEYIMDMDALTTSVIEAFKPGWNLCELFPSFKSTKAFGYILETGQTKKACVIKACDLIKNGKRTYANFIFQPFFDSKNEIVEILIIAVDVTNEIEHNEALQKISKIKDEFLSIISHEFKTPLTVITSALQTMELICKNDLTDKMKYFISTIRQNTLRQIRLVNNLLDITNAEGGYIKLHKKNIDIVALTNEIVKSIITYAGQRNLSIRFIPKIKSRIIAIDEEKYERILLNLLSNAIKFSPGGKTITVMISIRKNKICIQVKDEGIGISTQDIRKIFDRFTQVDSSFRRSAEGSGIGLSLVKLLVESMEGEITVKSRVGVGSTFKVLFPDAKVTEEFIDEISDKTLNGYLTQMIAAEFSDIYPS